MSIRSTFSSSAFFLSFLVFSSGNLCSVATGQPWGVTIAVLGSSTAFGTGPSHADSAWVNRYRKCITDLDSSSKVVNLALGGYTTYHMLPDDFVPLANRPAPDPARNITQALSLYPFAIIINLPSNDAASGYSISEQLSNYDLILEKASAAGVPVWISTTQPRNLSSTGRQNLMAMRDSTFTRFDNNAIDFWNGIAQNDGSIDPKYDCGDGIHLNDAAHRILFERVVEKSIFATVTKDLANKIYAYDFTIDPAFLRPSIDTSSITLQLRNPQNHQAQITAYIYNMDDVSIDSFPLYDDGRDGDSRSGDATWSGLIEPRPDEGDYKVDIHTTDSDTVFSRIYRDVARFTTIGPIVVDGCEFSYLDTIPNPGDNMRFRLSLKNNGKTATATELDATITSLDTAVSVSGTTTRACKDIPPGEAELTSYFRIIIADDCPAGIEVPIRVDIASDSHIFWVDTLFLAIYSGETGIVRNEENGISGYALCQNYPNPFNPVTTIEYTLPDDVYVEIGILDLLGRRVDTVVTGKHKAGKHQVTWDGQDADGSQVASGVYFYKMTAGEFTETRKFLLLR